MKTKETREASRAAQFEYLLTKGYNQTTFKSLDFFTLDEGKYFTLKVYKGTGANHIEYKNYHTAERRAAIIEQYKSSLLRHEQYKAEQKEKNKGKSSSHAASAAAIKQELKNAYPYTKFSVTSESFAGGDSVHISWTDGVTVEQVEKFSSKYQYGSFNSMEDIYEYSNNIEGLPQAKYVSENRTLSDEIIKMVAAELMKLKTYTAEELKSYRESPEQDAKQILYKTEIPHNYTGLQVAYDFENNNNNIFKVIFEVPEQPTATPQQFTEVETVKGEVNIVDYSEKAFAVIGDTKPIKDKLKALGGSFNPRLSCGAGWIFPKRKLDEITAALNEPEPDTVKSEVKKMIEFFAETDIKQCGEITESTKECARVQNVSLSTIEEETPKHYSNLQDIEAAAMGGKVISLYNLSQLVK